MAAPRTERQELQALVAKWRAEDSEAWWNLATEKAIGGATKQFFFFF